MSKVFSEFEKYDVSVKYVAKTEDELALKDFMAKRSIVLPDIYIEFIRRFGAVFILSPVMVKCESPLHQYTDDENFMSIGRFLDWGAGKFSIIHIMNMYKEQFPPRFVPISEKISGDFIGLDFSSEVSYSVCFWSHDAPLNTQLFRIADSFESFILSISEHEPKLPDNAKILPKKGPSAKMIELLKKTGKWKGE